MKPNQNLDAGRGRPIPLRTFKGHLRCIRLDDLSSDPLAREALEFVCGEFFGRDQNVKGHEGNEAAARTLGVSFERREVGFGYRRFAGGQDLPRSRYYTVAVDGSGRDGGALANELGAYSKIGHIGPVFIRDTLDFGRADWEYFYTFDKSRFASFEQFVDATKGKIVFHFDFRKSGVKFAFADTHHLFEHAPRVSSREYAVFVQTTVLSETIERCLDLRTPAAREWMIELLDRGIPGVRTTDRDGRFEPLAIEHELPEAAIQNAAESNPQTLFYGPDEDWNGQSHACAPGLPRLLAYLTYAKLGGSPLTDALGRHLRREGVEALVFPTARSDLDVEIKRGALTNWGGWALVDYRNAPPPHELLALIVEPRSWMRDMAGCSLACPLRGDPFEGSIRLTGPLAQLRAYVIQMAGGESAI